MSDTKRTLIEDGTELTEATELPFMARVMFAIFSAHVILADSDDG